MAMPVHKAFYSYKTGIYNIPNACGPGSDEKRTRKKDCPVEDKSCCAAELGWHAVELVG